MSSGARMNPSSKLNVLSPMYLEIWLVLCKYVFGSSPHGLGVAAYENDFTRDGISMDMDNHSLRFSLGKRKWCRHKKLMLKYRGEKNQSPQPNPQNE